MVEEPPFVDRGAELSELLSLAERGFYPVLYLYGPEGCGKTRLLRELYSRLRGRRDYVTVYVDAQSMESVEEAVYAPPGIVRAVLEAARELAGPPGRVAALALLSAMRIVKRLYAVGKHVVILVDDVARPLGLEVIEAYSKSLLNLVEELLEAGAETVLAIATTSEGLSRSLLARHNYVSIRQLWNLDPDSYAELLQALGAPKDVTEEAWRSLGGNPRLALALRARGWSLQRLEDDLYPGIRAVLEDIAPRHRRELEEVVEDVDALLEHPELRRKLLEASLVTPVDRPCLGYTPPIDPELGIGRYYAWQTPLHRRLARRYLEELG